MSTGVRLPPSSDDPLADRLAQLAHETEHPSIERVAREAMGMRAVPTASDHLSTITHTDGWLVASFDVDDQPVFIRRCPPHSGFELLAPDDDGEYARTNHGRFGVKALFERHESEWQLFGDVEERFASARDDRRWGEGVVQ
ncbi:hypothetical protein [Halomarina rubra]|uniref:Uncharacterized protein n=1 Tax=Halomarina rubra TaxID=2071873 RepID=A0ABD6ASK1_9EURY|nr:hypothetical protein [Halomarina rubra]